MTSRTSSRACSTRASVSAWLMEQQADGGPALLADRLVDGGEGWVGVGGVVDVVEADDRQVAGDRDPGLPGRVQRADRGHVAHGQDGGGSLAVGPGTDERLVPALDGGRGAHDVIVEQRGADLVERAPIAVQALGRDGRRRPVGPIGRLDAQDQDVAVTETEEVGGSRIGAGLVIDRDARGELGLDGVDEDDADARPADASDLRMARIEPDRDDPVDAGALHGPTQRTLAGGR